MKMNEIKAARTKDEKRYKNDHQTAAFCCGSKFWMRIGWIMLMMANINHQIVTQ